MKTSVTSTTLDASELQEWNPLDSVNPLIIAKITRFILIQNLTVYFTIEPNKNHLFHPSLLVSINGLDSAGNCQATWWSTYRISTKTSRLHLNLHAAQHTAKPRPFSSAPVETSHSRDYIWVKKTGGSLFFIPGKNCCDVSCLFTLGTHSSDRGFLCVRIDHEEDDAGLVKLGGQVARSYL